MSPWLAVVQQLVDYGLFSRRGSAATGAVAVLMVEMLVVAALEVVVAVAAARSKRAFGKRGRRRPVWVAVAMAVPMAVAVAVTVMFVASLVVTAMQTVLAMAAAVRAPNPLAAYSSVWHSLQEQMGSVVAALAYDADVAIDIDPEREHMAKVLSVVASMAHRLADWKTEAVVVALAKDVAAAAAGSLPVAVSQAGAYTRPLFGST